ncbi:MAG TPA: DNA replication/repair protein RecF [Verrucomicrobiota bacterium]|nr:DNA replication/repair protein RecF [Verrucomicrobiota bacterium]
MHLAHLRLRDFRNYGRVDADFSPGLHVLLGDNAQGKTNLLEAIYLMATLRSFRGVGGAQMVRHGQNGYFLSGRVVAQGTREIKMYWSRHERKLTLDDRPVRKLTDFLGALRTVVFCTEDLQLVKGTGRPRRRYLDLLLVQTRPGYLALLQRYAQVVRSRNAALKQFPPDPTLVESYTDALVQCGNALRQQREELIPQLLPLAQRAYRQIAPAAEEFHLAYAPSVRGDFAVELAQLRERERRLRMTLLGPHRDDLQLLLDGRAAAQFASEGQKRSLAIALKMAQADLLMARHGTAPVLLIDDVMGELDLRRRSGLLPLLDRVHEHRGQAFMTCTEESWPRELGRRLQRWQVKAGRISPW